MLSNVKGKSSVVMRALVSKPQLGTAGPSEMLQGRLVRNEPGKPERQRCGSKTLSEKGFCLQPSGWLP